MKTRFSGTFAGANVKKDGTVVLSFLAPQSEMASVLQSVLFIDHVMRVGVELDGSPIKVGKAAFNSIRVDKDGESRVVLDTDLDGLDISLAELKSFVNENMQVLFVSKEPVSEP